MPELSPDQVATKGFPTSFRGFDPAEVKAYLARVAEQLRAAQVEAEELRRRLREAEERAAHPDLDVDTLTSALGDETARILRSAQDAAADIRAKAEENVAHLLREAYEEAGRMRAEAESVLARETEVAEATAVEIRTAADADAAAALGRARQEAERLLEDVEGKARTMVDEAEARRAKVLGDLARRRKLAHTQVEQLRAGRDRLLEAYRMVRTTLDEVTEELVKAEAEARAAAEAAARRTSDEPVDEVVAGAPEPVPAESAPESEAPHAEPEPEPAPAPAPEEAAPAPDAVAEPGPAVAIAPPLPDPDERTQSSLRIIRRPKGEAEGERDMERNGFTPVAPRAAGEGVRIIRPEQEAPPEQEEQEPPSRAAEPTIAAPLPSERPVAAPRAGEPTIAAPRAAEVAEAPLPEEEATSAEEPEADEVPEPPAATVDDLFARIRADRAEAVARAREVLDPPSAGEEAEEAAEADDTAEADDAAEAVVAGDAADDEDEASLQRRDAVVEEIEARLTRRLKRALQDEQNALLDRFRSQRGRPTADAVLPAADEQPARYRAVAAEVLAEAARAGLAFAGGSADTAVDVGELADTLAAELVAPLRRRLERGFEEGADEDPSLLVERIGAAYRDTKGTRIEQLAADHVIAAFSRGSFVATPDGALLRWVVDDGAGSCPDCDDNALAGPTPRGEEYPTGTPHPPAHAGCRCLLVPAGP